MRKYAASGNATYCRKSTRSWRRDRDVDRHFDMADYFFAREGRTPKDRGRTVTTPLQHQNILVEVKFFIVGLKHAA